MIAIGSDALSAMINPLGAELTSLRDAAEREFMTDADPAFWSGHAPLLFPIVGALNGGEYGLDGRAYALPKHGFARTSRFELVEHEPDRALLRLADSEATRAVYPFAFALEMAFALDGATLGMTATVRNPGATPMPFSFGFHPAFAWPLPGGAAKDAHALVFERDEPQDIRRIDADGLVARSEPTPVAGRALALRHELFADDALIWDRLASRALAYGAPGGMWLDIAFPDTPMLGVWQKPGARYVCIEPWAGIADPAGYDGGFSDKPGVITLEPSGSRSFRMDVTVPGV
jgi:galactose mutarotase-like enzyme